MHAIKLKTKCPYEIGETIQFEKGSNAYYKGETKVMKITDIIIQVSEKTGAVTFILELDGWYKLNTNLHEVKSRSV